MSLAKRIEVLGEMAGAEIALAERALVPGMGTTFFDAAETHTVSLGDASPVFEMGNDIVPLGPARLARAYGLVISNVGTMFGAKVAPAVLTNLNGGSLTPREPPAELAGCRFHREAPGKFAKGLERS